MTGTHTRIAWGFPYACVCDPPRAPSAHVPAAEIGQNELPTLTESNRAVAADL